MLSKKPYDIYFVIIIMIVAMLLLGNNKGKTEKLDLSNQFETGNTEITGEIITGTVISQEFLRIYKEIESLELQFANFSDRNNEGSINIIVYNDGLEVANQKIDVSKIGDGEYIRVPFHRKVGELNDTLKVEITSDDGQEGKAVTLWMTENKMLSQGLNSKLVINGVESPKSLHLKINYIDYKMGYIFWFIGVLLFWGLLPLGIYKKMYERYKAQEICRYKINQILEAIVLIALAFILISLRDLSYITNPTLYAEDASYISNIFSNGLTRSIFMTRTGGMADFQNSGSYILLYFALKTNQFFYGYNLGNLPMFIGVYANLFWAIVAYSGYRTFKFLGKIEGITALLVIVLIPMGTSGGEVFGRVLNTVFIWPVFCTMILIMRYRNNAKYILGNTITGLICILCGLSFPVSYGVVGIYLIFSFSKAVKEKAFKQYIINEWSLLICMIIGIMLLPTMIQAEGITSTLTLRPSAIVEFVIARHILYPFIYMVYSQLNDSIVCLLFSLVMVLLVYALFLRIRRRDLLNEYILLLGCWGCVVFGSALMRIKMTAFFDQYQSSYPDRYFYGCNILSILVLVYAINIIFKNKQIGTSIKIVIQTVILPLLLINPYLFEFTNPRFTIYGAQNLGTLQQCVKQAIIDEKFSSEKPGFVNVTVYPVFDDGSWDVVIPLAYAITTSNSVK